MIQVFVSRRHRTLTKMTLVYLGLAFFVVTMLFPFFWMLITSLKSNQELYNLKQSPFWVEKPTLDQYTLLFTKVAFLTWLKNSLIVSLVSTLVSLLVGIPAGYAIARLRFKGAEPIGLGIFITYLVPTTLLFLPLAYVIRSIGLYDSIWSLMLTYPTFLIPFCTWLLMGYFKGIPKDLEESAIVDGATRLQALLKIVLPLALPGIVSAGLFAFTLSWNEFVYALTFIQSNGVKTIPVGVVGQLTLGDVFFWGSLMAAGLIGSVPIVIFYGFFLEYYVKGMTAGAVKG